MAAKYAVTSETFAKVLFSRHVCDVRNSRLWHGLPTSEASSTMRALSSARCTDVRLYTLRIKIDTNQRALGELSRC